MLASSCIHLLLYEISTSVSVPKHLKMFTALEQALNSFSLAMHSILIYRHHRKRQLKWKIAVQFGMHTPRKSSSLRTIFCSIPASTGGDTSPNSPLSTCVWCWLLSGTKSATNASQGHPAESTSMQLPTQGLLPSAQKSAAHTPAFVTEQCAEDSNLGNLLPAQRECRKSSLESELYHS